MITSIIICLVYLLVLVAIQKITKIPYPDITKNTRNIKRGLFYPVLLGSIFLTVLAITFGWWQEIWVFKSPYKPLYLWIVPIVLVIASLARLRHSKWRLFTRKSIIFLAISTLLVGYSEELLARGIIVTSLEKAGYGVLMIGLLSSLIFGLAHSINFLTGQDAKTTTIQVVTTSLYGLNFFLILLVSGNLWVPVLIHALHDFSVITQGAKINDTNITTSPTDTVLSVTSLVLPIVAIYIFALQVYVLW